VELLQIPLVRLDVLKMAFIGIFVFVLGAILASFIGVVAERAYTGQSWKQGRSRCNSCRRELRVQDLLPIASWLMWRGRCRTCKSKVPFQYILYEIALGTLFVLSFLVLGLTLELLIFLLALCMLFFIVIYDLRHTLVPGPASTALIVFGALHTLVAVPGFLEVSHAVLTAGLISFFFFLLYFLSGGRAMGLGDTPVAFGLSLLVGKAALPGLFFSFWVGGVIGIIILVLRKGGPKMGIEVPFVPFMAAGFLLAFFTQWNPLPF
jgi:prepilin signal peptidase PulO-like enzyme (type II secretory pathway)